jgi:hypothetical protein
MLVVLRRDGPGAIVIAFSSGGLSRADIRGIIYFHLFNDKAGGEEKSFTGLGTSEKLLLLLAVES